ncbi:PD-(D/E)XK nuclease family protein [Candidatus Woesebacteria bacterium]|nr:PD-(D/E)XK nuclease family protein [Candidatus Woesebacteria bacterium]
MPDKFAATWVSHSSIAAFRRCPRAYFLGNVYKDPTTNHKIQLVSPALALGQTVHEVLESLSVLPGEERFKRSLIDRFDTVWKKVSGKRGGFTSEGQEMQFKHRGEEMLRRVMASPGPLKNKAVKIKADLPQYWLSESDEIILCGKIDWLEYLPEQDAVHIIDFKTGKNEEDANSLQLPIYHLLVHNTQSRTVAKVSYWYLGSSDELQEKELPSLQIAEETVLHIAKQMRLARKLGVFKCPQGEGGCFACSKLEKIVRGEAVFIGESEYRQDQYYIPDEQADGEDDSYLI